MLTPTQLCKCLGDDIRLSLICLLHGQGEVCVCDLVEAMQAPQSTVSRHLAQLRQCELVVARRQGTWMHYRINPDLPAWAQQTLASLVSPAREALSLKLPVSACCEN
ncbi:metalloregulator ArsR/SmtB family transcription factor [Alcanivorax sp.]|uniref:metalloregulator ArsR/SmtB family transcription factor n=1 Tax=Alcanivorax sp. TaxID=1872427 RepID=UPI002B272D37|nr:metalloregulator ArsR/SmtB family transcription factor [Alcanivorax sp.]